MREAPEVSLIDEATVSSLRADSSSFLNCPLRKIRQSLARLGCLCTNGPHISQSLDTFSHTPLRILGNIGQMSRCNPRHKWSLQPNGASPSSTFCAEVGLARPRPPFRAEAECLGRLWAIWPRLPCLRLMLGFAAAYREGSLDMLRKGQPGVAAS